MYSKQVVSAIAALGMAAGAMAVGCDDPTATIRSAADATALANCDTVQGSVVIDSGAGSTLDMSGRLTEIKGDLSAQHNGALITLSSTSLRTIGKAFSLRNVTLMSTLKFTALESVGSIDWATLNALQQLTFGNPGVTKANSVIITDTLLSSLEGINVKSLAVMNINNNHRLTDFSTQLSNLTDKLIVSANGMNLTVNMPNLQTISNMEISNVTRFSAPSLHTVNGSMKFESNYFESFLAPNLTGISDGDVSFISNPQVTSISMPNLEKVGGGFTIANNTALKKLTGFPALTNIGGAVKLRGSFSEVALPQIKDVKGAFDVSSTENIQSSCDALGKFAPKSGGQIQGDYSCTSNNQNANNDTSGAGSSGTGNKNAGSPLSISMSTVVTLAALGAVVSAFL